MPAAGVRAAGRRRAPFIYLLWIALFAGVVFLIAQRKDALTADAAAFLERTIERETGLRVHVDHVGGDLTGSLRLEGFSVVDPARVGDPPVFRARVIEARYRLLDFVSKRFSSKISIKAQDVDVHWSARSGLKRESFPILRWLRDWVLAQKDNWRVSAENVRFTAAGRKPIEGIAFSFSGDAFEAAVPFRHEEWFGADISTTVVLSGKFSLGLGRAADSLAGTLSTEGTIVNWAPLLEESSIDFVMTRDSLSIGPSTVLGGIRVEGSLAFPEGPEMKLRLQAEDYPLSNWAPFLKIDRQTPLPTRADFDLRFRGSPWAPAVAADVRIYEGWISGNKFKALDLHLDGIYPSFRLSDSRILMPDNSVMRFADTNLEVSQVFSEKILKRLVAEAQQDTVVWGTWEFTRAQSHEKEEDDFLMQKSLGKYAKLEFRKYGEPEKDERDPSDPRKMEAALVYKLKSNDSLKVGLRDDERFVGVEHKMSF